MPPISPDVSPRHFPTPSPPPPAYTVQPHDTVQSIAQAYGITPEEVARTNGMAVTTALAPGQTLNLPGNAVPPQPSHALPSNQTLQQNTDAAVSAYQNAVQQAKLALQNAPRNAGIRDDISRSGADQVNSAQQALNTAIQDEIAGEIANRNNGVPAQFRTPADQLTNSFSQAILQRYQGNPAAQSAIGTGITNYKASIAIAVAQGNDNSIDKLQSLSTQLQGQSPDVINQVLDDSRVQGWIQDEANQVAQPYANVPQDQLQGTVDQATDAMNRLQTITQSLSPDLAAAVTQASMPTIQKVAQLEINQVGGAVPFNTLQSVLANLGNGDQANAAIQQAADAYANVGAASSLVQRGSDLGTLENSILAAPGYGAAGNPNFAIALGHALQDRGLNDLATAAFNSGAHGVQDYLANDGASPLKQYQAAHDAAEQKDQKLAQLLAQSGPLSYTQEQAFIKAYRNDPDNAQAYQADAAAAKTLATYMQNNQSSLIFAAGRNPAAAQQLYGAMKDLAQSGQGETALRFAGYVDNDAAASKAFSQFSDYHTTFETDAVQAATGQLLVENGGDTKAAGSQLLQLADPVFKGRNGWNQVKEGIQAMADGDTNAFNAASFAEGYKEMGASGKAWAIAAVTVDSLNGANADKIDEMINAFSMAGGDVSEVGTGVLQVMADAGKFGTYNVAAETMAKLGARFVPGLAMIASTSAFASDFNSVKENANSPTGAVYALAMAGDVVTVLGSFMENFPLTAVPGEIVSGIGTVIAAPFELIGHILDGNKEQQEFQEEQVKYLQASGIDKEEAEAMAKDGGAINAFAQQLGLNPQQAQAILMTHPEAFDQGTPQTQALINLVKACQIQPADANGFLSALAQDNPNYVSEFYNLVTSQNSAMPLTNSSNLVSMIDKGGYTNARAYVQSHAPGVFSPDGYARRQADRDYEMALSGGAQQQMYIGNDLKANHDPVYQSEMIGIMKKNGTLDNWVQQIARAGNGWPQAAISAVQNAQNAGVLSAGEAQQYLNELR